MVDFRTENPDAEVVVVVDATFGQRIDSSEGALFEDAIVHQEIVTPPAGANWRGDAFVLRIAEKVGATVLSNDSFQDFHAEHKWLFDKGRLIGGKPVPGSGWIFTPRLPVRRPKKQGSGQGRDAVAVSSIFISYRRNDTSGYGGRLQVDLRRHFGSDRVFLDVDAIRPGSDFAEVINQAVSQSKVVLVLIGRTWLNATNKRRLQEPDDFVRLEIESAFGQEQEIVVVPVLVGGAKMPTSGQLPTSISRLGRTQGIELTDERWEYDISRLIRVLEEQL